MERVQRGTRSTALRSIADLGPSTGARLSSQLTGETHIPMNAKRMLLAFGAAAAVTGVSSVPAAQAGGYPIKCTNNTAIVVDDETGAQKRFTEDGAIQAAVD